MPNLVEDKNRQKSPLQNTDANPLLLAMSCRFPNKIQKHLLRAYRHLVRKGLNSGEYNLLKCDPRHYLLNSAKVRDQRFVAFLSLFGPSPTETSTAAGSGEMLKLAAYAEQYQKTALGSSPDFVPINETAVQAAPGCPSVIAFYLPQFYPFPLNDRWWGKGFTEWTNVTKAAPFFVGHHQPQLPIDVGFYDLRLPESFARQVELARLYGISAFCFYYYWFSGQRLLERPLDVYLTNPDLDLPFCICWANESWTRRWDGKESDVLMEQDLKDVDDEKFIIDLLPFLKDQRYLKVGGKPLVLIYRPQIWNRERVLRLTENMRRAAADHGFSGLYLVNVLGFSFEPENISEWGFDAAVELPPHPRPGFKTPMINIDEVYTGGEKFKGRVFEAKPFAEFKMNAPSAPYTVFRTAFPAWDNTARHGLEARIYQSSPAIYKKWLSNALNYTARFHSADEQFVFINAWNEWAEGAHLEPDRRYGYAYLEATAEALREFVRP